MGAILPARSKAGRPASPDPSSEYASTGRWRALPRRNKVLAELLVEAHLDLEKVDGRRLVLESTRDIAHQTEITSSSPAEFLDRFTGRITALAAAHGLLVQSE